jgi:hypothetical protein
MFNFKVHRIININKEFLKKYSTGQICLEWAEVTGFSPDIARQPRRSNLPAGPGRQRQKGTESVPDVAVRPIRRQIDDWRLSSPSRRGWG